MGFRPFVFRLAEELDLSGWVLNSSHGVFIEVEGARSRIDDFLRRVNEEKPPRAVIFSLETSFLEPRGYDSFEIRESDDSGSKTTLIPPDIATCAECLAEIFDPADRRYHYPFTNCTNCGPRYSILKALPYDRPNTSMEAFRMCPACEAEYRDPRNRRFHAQPNACPGCGPRLQWFGAPGEPGPEHHDALLRTAEAIRAGKIVALKGLGGFQLIADARNEEAVQRLRHRKHREEKPFALMVPDLTSGQALCHLSEQETRLLTAVEAPIVLARRLDSENDGIARAVAPRNPILGVMLPSTPLHHLLMRELGFPVVATSGNLSGEPICIDNGEAVHRLSGIADGFLAHDRPIVRHVDDSVARVVAGREQILRRARGYAPLPIHASAPAPTILATGAHLKNTVALNIGAETFISQHIGDLDSPMAYEAFQRVCQDLQALYGATPEAIACDLHPEYLSTKFAKTLRPKALPVQHHFAHVAACMAENELEPPVLGISWDGTGYGTDGTIWGGEFLIADGTPFTRAAHFRPFRLPGGETAIREPRRCALGLFFELSGEALFDQPERAPLSHFESRELSLIRQALARQLNAPLTSSAGRLFDAVASLLGIRQRVSFEGQAAMELEFAIDHRVSDAYTFDLKGDDPIVVDWEPVLWEIQRDLQLGVSPGVMSARFHNGLVEAAVAVTQRAGLRQVVLTGGCFQNRYLTERLVQRLREEGFRPAWHQRVPPNDGGIALGQIAAVAQSMGQQPLDPLNEPSGFLRTTR